MRIFVSVYIYRPELHMVVAELVARHLPRNQSRNKEADSLASPE